MSLLSERDIAKSRLSRRVETLLETYDIDGKFQAEHKREWDKKNVIEAKTRLYEIEKELAEIKHAGHSKVEMYAKLMLIFKPELKEEVEKLITFT